MKNQSSGFTLIEIIITVLLLGIIAALAFNSYETVIEKMRAKEGEQMVYAGVAEQKRCELEGYSAATSLCFGGQSDILQESQIFPKFAFSTAVPGSGISSFYGVYRAGSDMIFISNHEGTITGGNPGMYVLYIVHGGPAGNDLVMRCREGASSPGICAKLGY